jgi:hypothetical protein
MTGVHVDRDRPGVADPATATAAVPGVARGAAVACWVYAAGYGLPALPIAAYALRERELPWLGDLFPMYGGPWWGPLSPEAFAATLVGYAGVTAAVAWGGWLVWQGRRSGAVLAVAMIPIEAVFWYGYALPIPPAGAPAGRPDRRSLAPPPPLIDPDAKQVRAVHDRHACRLDAASYSSRPSIGIV